MTFHTYTRTRRLAVILDTLEQRDAMSSEHSPPQPEDLAQILGLPFFRPGASALSSEESISLRRIDTPIGPMIAGATAEGLCLLEFSDRRMLETQLRRVTKRLDRPLSAKPNPHIDQIEAELREYFRGDRDSFGVPLVLAGTPFQETVWHALLEIPYGETVSYDELARRVDCPGGQRAVGGANGDNRIAIVVPCHRVIRSDGALGGYGGGLPRKQHLLDLEKGSLQEDLFEASLA